jgi:hypothetical protein
MTLGNYGPNSQQYSSSNDTSSENFDLPISISSKIISIFMCIPSSGYERFFRTYIPIFDILLVAVIPFFLLCCTNLGIIIYTMRNNRRMRQHHKRKNHRHQRLTIMLLSVTLAFIGLTCPSVIFICVNKLIYSMPTQKKERSDNLNELIGGSQPSKVQSFVDICEALWYTKHAMNFILYTLSGQDFRREFIKSFTQCCTGQSYLIRKLLNKTQATTSTNQSTVDTQVRVLNIHNERRRRTEILKTDL